MTVCSTASCRNCAWGAAVFIVFMMCSSVRLVCIGFPNFPSAFHHVLIARLVRFRFHHICNHFCCGTSCFITCSSYLIISVGALRIYHLGWSAPLYPTGRIIALSFGCNRRRSSKPEKSSETERIGEAMIVSMSTFWLFYVDVTCRKDGLLMAARVVLQWNRTRRICICL